MIAAVLPDIPQGWALVLVALIGGPVLVWTQTHSTKKEARAAKVTAAEAKKSVERVEVSVGPKNGHGTVQDATGVMLNQGDQILRELAEMRRTQHAMQTSIDSVVESASTVNQRLKALDREISEVKRRGGG